MTAASTRPKRNLIISARIPRGLRERMDKARHGWAQAHHTPIETVTMNEAVNLALEAFADRWTPEDEPAPARLIGVRARRTQG